MREIRWGKRARDDLDRIDRHCCAIDPEIANAIARKVVAAAQFLAEWPHAGALLAGGHYRSWTVRASPYVIVYRSHASHISILRIRHGRENWREA